MAPNLPAPARLNLEPDTPALAMGIVAGVMDGERKTSRRRLEEVQSRSVFSRGQSRRRDLGAASTSSQQMGLCPNQPTWAGEGGRITPPLPKAPSPDSPPGDPILGTGRHPLLRVNLRVDARRHIPRLPIHATVHGARRTWRPCRRGLLYLVDMSATLLRSPPRRRQRRRACRRLATSAKRRRPAMLVASPVVSASVANDGDPTLKTCRQQEQQVPTGTIGSVLAKLGLQTDFPQGYCCSCELVALMPLPAATLGSAIATISRGQATVSLALYARGVARLSAYPMVPC